MIVKKYKIGSIHGRFQPFHKGHARYLNQALSKCEHLIIGITQYDIKSLKQTPDAGHRSLPENNPLSYAQRCTLIETYLEGQNIPSNCYEFTPFPIEEPEKIKDFIPQQTVCFTTRHHERWNNSKIKKLESQGFRVEVLMYPDESTTNTLSATQVRDSIRKHNQDWEQLIPENTIKKLRDSGGVSSILESSLIAIDGF